jgi:hypothetical protein
MARLFGVGTDGLSRRSDPPADRGRAEGGGQKVVVKCGRMIGLRLKEAPKARAGRPQKIGNFSLPITDRPATLEQMVGSKMKAHRLKKLADHTENEIEEVVEALAKADIDITEGAVRSS